LGFAGTSHRIGEVEFILGSGERDIEEPAFLFEHVLIIGFENAAVGELAVHEPDEEDSFPFESLGLVDGGEGDHFVVVIGYL
jgi:hypothetical protein